MSNLYGSYDAFVGGGGQDLYGSYDAMPGAPAGADMGGYAGNYNSYDSYIGNGAGYGAPQGYGYADPYAQGGYGGGYQQGYGSRAPNPQVDLHDVRGVGITFDQKPSPSGTSAVFVKRIASGSSAARTGQVRVGDVLMAVNGVNVAGRPISSLRPIIPGPAGSTVCLSFRRYDGRVYDVNLRRTTPRLGTKNSRYYSGIRHTAPASPPQQHFPPAYQQQQQPQFHQPQFYSQPQFPSYAPVQPQYTMLAPQQTYQGATLLSGQSYILPQGGFQGGFPTQSISYAPAQQPISYISAAPQTQQFSSYSNNVTYQQAGQDEIKGTQV